MVRSSWWSKLSNVTCYFTARIGAHSPAVNWITRPGLDFNLALFKECQGIVVQSQIVPPFWSLFHPGPAGLGVLACSINTGLNYGITILFIRTGTNRSRQSYYQKKSLPTFLKTKNRQLGMRLASGYILEYGNSR